MDGLHGGQFIAMSAIEALVLEHLAKQDELVGFERGVLWQQRDGETRLWFQPLRPSHLPELSISGKCANASPATRFV